METAEELSRYRRAIEAAFHHLNTEHGLWATDQPQAYADAMKDGLDSEEAFKCFQETLHRLDHKATIAELNSILNTPIPPLVQMQNELAQAQATIAKLKSARYKFSDDPEMVWNEDYGWLHQNIEDEISQMGATIVHLQEKCEKIPGYMAQAEAHRALLMERDATIAALVAEIRGIAEESCLPDGDGVTVPVALWAESVLERFARQAAEYTACIQADERRRVLEEVWQIVTATVDGEPIQPAEIERRINEL